MKAGAYIFLVASIILVFVFSLGCTGTITKTVTVGSSPQTIVITTYPPAAPPPTGDVIIVIGGGYADRIVYVSPGQKFVWINEDHEAHTVTSDSNPPLFDFSIQPGQYVAFSIDAVGRYAYYDRLHPMEYAEIDVVED